MCVVLERCICFRNVKRDRHACMYVCVPTHTYETIKIFASTVVYGLKRCFSDINMMTNTPYN